MKTTVTFGEVMLRLRSTEHYKLFQLPSLEATFGGGEANVAVSLSTFGLPARFVSAVPANLVGDSCLRELNKYGVDTSVVSRKGDRLGIYFLETGANQRASKVVYDRAHSAISEASVEDFDWDKVFDDAGWFHITGISPAISESAAELSIKACEEAQKRGITVSIDLNFRKKLWKYGKTAPEVMPELVKNCDVIIANEEDCQKSLGISLDAVEVESGELPLEHYKELSDNVLAAYPNVKSIAITLRESISADHNNWSAIFNNREGFYHSKRYEIHNIIDRVGGGDSFAGGLIFGLQTEDNAQDALEYAVAASCLKHSISGDFNLTSKEDVYALAKGDGSGRVQR